MKIFFTCNICSQPYIAPSVTSGFVISCHKCQTRIKIPLTPNEPPNVIQIELHDVFDVGGETRHKIIEICGHHRKPTKEDLDYITNCVSQREIP